MSQLPITAVGASHFVFCYVWQTDIVIFIDWYNCVACVLYCNLCHLLLTRWILTIKVAIIYEIISFSMNRVQEWNQIFDKGTFMLRDYDFRYNRKRYLIARRRKSLKIVWLANRYLCISSISLKVYSPIDCIKLMNIQHEHRRMGYVWRLC